mmetsp:Transcript_6619/g.11687  ORF Transcript_6619/g.11687 Transcript_6619/m.11687 type:complete len:512 (+) Transcript_6619:373-1908(+)
MASHRPAGTGNRVCVIGAGFSGLGCARVWMECGFDVVVLEKNRNVGGQWVQAYEKARLQNTSVQYRFPDLDYKGKVDRHPTKIQVLKLAENAAEKWGIDVHYGHHVVKMEQDGEQWLVHIELPSGDVAVKVFDFVEIATGVYSPEQKLGAEVPNREAFRGTVLSHYEPATDCNKKKVVVVGFGKTALDCVVEKQEQGAHVTHVFRTARWMIPDYIGGLVDYTMLLFSRFGTLLMPCWSHPTLIETAIHTANAFVTSFWYYVCASLFLLSHYIDARVWWDNEKMVKIMPPRSEFLGDLRSACPVAPRRYTYLVAHQHVQVCCSEVKEFYSDGIVLENGERVECDTVYMCIGNGPPKFPFLPDKYRKLLEGQRGGPQLYRHLVHPQLGNVGFIGFNNSFILNASVRLGALWHVAMFQGRLQVPPREEMENSVIRIARWKRSNIHFEPCSNTSVNTRFQQYNDILCSDLGISPYRKLPNLFAEVFLRYDPSDYAGVVQEYLNNSPLKTTTLNFD